MHRLGYRAIYWIVEIVIDEIKAEIEAWDIKFLPIWYKEKIDGSSGKVREIGIQNVKQQIYDYIAVEGLRPLLVRIGEFQVASIKGRGQSYGTRFIRRWFRNKSIRYFGQADIKKCYASIDREKLMNFLQKHVKNDLLLKLIERLIYTFKQGLSIGSYLSQFLCNLYLSELYHEIAEKMYRIRKHKDGTTERVNLVMHALLFMDDIFICGSNAKDLHRAMKLIQDKATEMGLNIKLSWKVVKARVEDRGESSKKGEFVDIMGTRFYRTHITIRRRTFKRIKRAYSKAWKQIKIHRRVPLVIARKCMSYNGIIQNTDSHKVKGKYHVAEVKRVCRKVVAEHDSCKVRGKAEAGQLQQGREQSVRPAVA